MNSTGLGSYSRNHLAMVSGLEDVDTIVAFSPKIRIQDDRLRHTKILVVRPKEMWNFIPSLWRRTTLGRLAHHYRASIYHGLSAELPSDIDQFPGKKVVTVHDVLFKTRPYDYSTFDRRMHDYKLRKALASADLIHCISNQTKSELSEHYQIDPSRIRVIYQSVHPHYFHAEEYRSLVTPPFERFILSVGTIEPRKNTLSLLEAVDELQIPLVLVGRIKSTYQNKVYPVYNRLKKKRLLLHIQPSDSTELASWYHHASLVVYPSLAEGFGLPPLEASAAGRVCITGPSPCLAEASGLPECQTSGTTGDLIIMISRLWSDEMKIRELSSKARHHALQFTQEKIGLQWQNTYNTLI